jgi:hypothetical protein
MMIGSNKHETNWKTKMNEPFVAGLFLAMFALSMFGIKWEIEKATHKIICTLRDIHNKEKE